MMSLSTKATFSESQPIENGEDVERTQSHLVADFGRCYTTVSLFDVIEGATRLVAQGRSLSTHGSPWFNVSEGFRQAIGQISDATWRRLIDGQQNLIRPERPDGAGVDSFSATISVADPLRVLTVGLLEEASVASARNAIQTIYATEVDSFSLADKRNRQAQVEAMLNHSIDVIFIAGGTDGGPDRRLMDLVRTIAMGLSLMEDISRPIVIYAGNNRLRSRVQKTLGELTFVNITGNVLPSYNEERLDDALGILSEAYLSLKAEEVPGLKEIVTRCNVPPQATAHACGGISEYYAAVYGGRVLCLDVGSHSASLVSANQGSVDLVVRSDLGLGEPLANFLDEMGPSEILAWSESELPMADVEDLVFNKACFPQIVPLTDHELNLESALLRAIIGDLTTKAGESWGWAEEQIPLFKLLLIRGSSLVSVGRSREALQTVLDPMRPSGIFAMVADRYGILPAMGLLAPQDPLAVVQLLGSGILERWGWVIAPIGEHKTGQAVLKLELIVSGQEAKQFEIVQGSLEVLPLTKDQTAEVKLQPASNIDIGFGPGKGHTITIRGGSVGLVVDARERPIRRKT